MVEVRFPGYACMYRFVKTFKAAAGRKKPQNLLTVRMARHRIDFLRRLTQSGATAGSSSHTFARELHVH